MVLIIMALFGKRVNYKRSLIEVEVFVLLTGGTHDMMDRW